MNIYDSLNKLSDYIEENIEEKLEIKKMAKLVGITPQVLQSIFSLLTNIGLSEYIRLRKLTLAKEDLKNGNSVMEVSLKYGYNSATSFSRAFMKFHGCKPSEIKKGKKGAYFSILQFDEKNALLNLSYRIEKIDAFSLYGIKKRTNEKKISEDAPKFFSKINKKYNAFYGDIPYAMVLYKERFKSSYLEYWCLYEKENEEFTKVDFPTSKWLIFSLNSREARDIQNLSHTFYNTFLPKNKYKLKNLPELEVYLENEKTEFRIAID